MADYGIVIRNKPHNVAFSQYGINALMKSNGDIKKAGRLAAFQFSDDFRRASQIEKIGDSQLNIKTWEIPRNECEFMKNYSDFDKISAWHKGGDFIFSNDECG
ncbi:MAG: hypothetical protein LBS21_09720, partial [Clostridiales bacterium]|nr:hypothetical protein [Clostridiales bacterium]